MRRVLGIFAFLLLASVSAQAKVTAVTSSTDLASIVREIGGEQVEVTSIGQGKSNLHFVEILPSYMLKVSRANIYFKVGLSIDRWADGVIDGARNDKLHVVDCSSGVPVLERPTGKVDASMGDIHVEGNPHYWLDPRNGKVIARNVLDGLSKVDPKSAAAYRANYDVFVARLDSAWQVWEEKAAACRGMRLVSYHSTFVYFVNAFGLEVIGYVEPKPGIEPTPSHTSELIALMKERGVRTIFREPYYSERAPAAIAKATGATVYTAPSSVGGTPEAKDYFSLFDALIGLLIEASARS